MRFDQEIRSITFRGKAWSFPHPCDFKRETTVDIDATFHETL